MARRHGSWVSLAIAQKERFLRAGDTMETGFAKIARDGQDDMTEGLSGRLPSKELRRRGHPYGRGRSARYNYLRTGDLSRRGASGTGRARLWAPLLPINRQTGRLLSSVSFRRVGRGAWDLGVGRGVPYARYVLHPAGTVFMVGRGLMGWRKTSGAYPMGLIERKFRTRVMALRRALREAYRR